MHATKSAYSSSPIIIIIIKIPSSPGEPAAQESTAHKPAMQEPNPIFSIRQVSLPVHFMVFANY